MLGNNNNYKVKHFYGMTLYWSPSQALLYPTFPFVCSILMVEFVKRNPPATQINENPRPGRSPAPPTKKPPPLRDEGYG